ncbi:uncharacterized protein H6S33_007037 [Morchella sextelata]|uniref:uncharacterized protein n=1 Tax=Morchella sextelata TaxID=1174677 RepID=UPI001D059EA6|nr:uncharacterized protein H6S33_007037 [Morchella sextelata]KAH0604006.1 hypothetical protein H6S33_007037 [Morchella sextelata]
MYCESVASMCQETLDTMDKSLEAQPKVGESWEKAGTDQSLPLEIGDDGQSSNSSVRPSSEGPISIGAILAPDPLFKMLGASTPAEIPAEQATSSRIVSEPVRILNLQPSAAGEQAMATRCSHPVCSAIEIISASWMLRHEKLISDINNVLHRQENRKLNDDNIIEDLIELDRNAHRVEVESDLFTWVRGELLARPSKAGESAEDDFVRFKIYVMKVDAGQQQQRELELRQWIHKRILGHAGLPEDVLNIPGSGSLEKMQ